MTRSVQRDSRRLSWLLRHGARETKLAMDGAGWAAVTDVLRELGLSRDALDRAVAENDKGRLQIDGERIRACQGHSVDGVPVSVDELEASWEEVELDTLWHGTSLVALEGIAQTGINPGVRTHVHLAERSDSKIGKRANVDLLLEISGPQLRARKLNVYRAPNGVLLVRCVPTVAIADALPFRADPSAVRDACMAVSIPCSA